MLNVNTLPKETERWRINVRRRRRKTKTKTKTKDENVDRKRTEEEKKYFKTNVLVPKTTVLKKEEGATVGVCRPFCSLPFLSGLTRLSFVGSKAVLQRKSKPLGNTHKIPFISDYRVVASTKFLDFHFCLALQNKWNKYKKMQMNLTKTCQT